MNTKLRNIVVLAILCAAALATWVLSRPQSIQAPQTSSTEQLPAGYYLRDAILIGTDSQGRVYYRVYAEIVEQASREDDLVLRQVRVEYEPEAQVRWSLTAQEGTAPSDRAYFDLLHSVRLTSQTNESSEATIIETEALRLYTDSFLASSDLSVAMHRGKTELHATGLRAHLKDDFLELPNVSGLVHP